MIRAIELWAFISLLIIMYARGVNVPSERPTRRPSAFPTLSPTRSPSNAPTRKPSNMPTHRPTRTPSAAPTRKPSNMPTIRPSRTPSAAPTRKPSGMPSVFPTYSPSAEPTIRPTPTPTELPTAPSSMPSSMPTPFTPYPTSQPTSSPSARPTISPQPTSSPSTVPSVSPSTQPTSTPSSMPSPRPTSIPTSTPTSTPTSVPSSTPTSIPTSIPTSFPSSMPSSYPTSFPTTPVQISLTMGVIQILDDIDKSTFDSDSNSQTAFQATILDIIPELARGSIDILSTEDVSEVATLARVGLEYLDKVAKPGLERIHQAPLTQTLDVDRTLDVRTPYSTTAQQRRLQTGTQLQVNYALTFVIQTLGYDSTRAAVKGVRETLNRAVADGTFTTALRSNAAQLGAAGLQVASATTAVTASVSSVDVLRSAAPTKAPTSRDNGDDENEVLITNWPDYAYAIFALGLFAVVILVLAAVIVCCIKKYRSQGEMGKEGKEAKLPGAGAGAGSGGGSEGGSDTDEEAGSMDPMACAAAALRGASSEDGDGAGAGGNGEEGTTAREAFGGGEGGRGDGSEEEFLGVHDIEMGANGEASNSAEGLEGETGLDAGVSPEGADNSDDRFQFDADQVHPEEDTAQGAGAGAGTGGEVEGEGEGEGGEDGDATAGLVRADDGNFIIGNERPKRTSIIFNAIAFVKSKLQATKHRQYTQSAISGDPATAEDHISLAFTQEGEFDAESKDGDEQVAAGAEAEAEDSTSTGAVAPAVPPGMKHLGGESSTVALSSDVGQSSESPGGAVAGEGVGEGESDAEEEAQSGKAFFTMENLLSFVLKPDRACEAVGEVQPEVVAEREACPIDGAAPAVDINGVGEGNVASLTAMPSSAEPEAQGSALADAWNSLSSMLLPEPPGVEEDEAVDGEAAAEGAAAMSAVAQERDAASDAHPPAPPASLVPPSAAAVASAAGVEASHVTVPDAAGEQAGVIDTTLDAAGGQAEVTDTILDAAGGQAGVTDTTFPPPPPSGSEEAIPPSLSASTESGALPPNFTRPLNVDQQQKQQQLEGSKQSTDTSSRATTPIIRRVGSTGSNSSGSGSSPGRSLSAKRSKSPVSRAASRSRSSKRNARQHVRFDSSASGASGSAVSDEDDDDSLFGLTSPTARALSRTNSSSSRGGGGSGSGRRAAPRGGGSTATTFTRPRSMSSKRQARQAQTAALNLPMVFSPSGAAGAAGAAGAGMGTEWDGTDTAGSDFTPL